MIRRTRKLYIFDLDSTLWDGRDLYPDVLSILTNIRKNGHYVYIASFNPYAPQILRRLRIAHLFHGGAYGTSATKYAMIRQIMDHSAQENNVEFYDDLLLNIIEVNARRGNQDIRAVHIINGLKWSDVY